MKFNEFDLSDGLSEALGYMGIDEPTPIQTKSIPIIMQGNDLLACAQTGTGKTAAFVIPIIESVLKANFDGVKALILSPTRELAIQIEQQIQGIAYFSGIRSIALYGGGSGESWVNEKSAILDGTDIVVATPGKIIAHLRMGYVDLSKLKFFVLDEADKMLDIGFFEDILEIKSHIKNKVQSLMFSATMPDKVRKLAGKILEKPESISLEMSKPAEGVEQGIFVVSDKDKDKLLERIINDNLSFERILVFTSTKKKVNEIKKRLYPKFNFIECISSDLEQKDREEVLLKFRAKIVKILVATDIISRGIDIKDIDLVINYDVPGDPEEYVHRVGRTARAKNTGMAVTFVNEEDMYKFDRIEKLIESEILRIDLPEEIGVSPEWKINNRYSNKKNFRKKGYSHKKKKPQ